ncbi:hypothetical protein G9A89_006963 [Geosiphon pyriformis]|nr:hypothetical protein G9A89_006963 [Geosiphon pyriformis]
MQLIGLWQKALVKFVSSDMASSVAFKYTMAHDLSDLIKLYGGKTCFIGHNPSSYVYNKCAVVCFANEASKLVAIDFVPVYKGVNLHWAGFSLACYTKCEQFGHISNMCSVASFGGKTWAQIAGGSLFCVALSVFSGTGLFLSTKLLVLASNPLDDSSLADCMASLECSMELLSDQVSEILRKLNFVELMPMLSPSCVPSPIAVSLLNSALNSNMAVDSVVVLSSPSLLVVGNAISELSLSSSKILITKIGGLELKIIALEVSVSLDKVYLWIMNKFDGVHVFTSKVNSDYLDSGIAIIMDISLARHVCKVSKVPGWILSVSGDFNENESHKYASFKKCFDLGLVNFLARSSFAKIPTWYNSCGIAKTIDYVFIFLNLVNTMVGYNITSVVDYFDTDHIVVSVFVSLDSLLDVQLFSLCKQVNKDYWKFDVKSANERKWCKFRDPTAANAAMLSSAFTAAEKSLDLDIIWDIVHRVMVFSTNGTFKRKWFKDYDSVFTNVSFKFHKLKLLVFRLVKASHLVSSENFALLLGTWDRLDSSGAAEIKSFFLSGFIFDAICSGLAKARKFYHSSKLLEFKCAEESHIKQTITSRIKSFELNKGHIIRSVLEHLFHKVVLDHLVVDNELVLEPDLPLDYVFNGVFFNVMCLIGSDKLFAVVLNLPNRKAAGLFGIFNEL